MRPIPRRSFLKRQCAMSFLLLASSGCGSAGQAFHGVYAVTGTAHYSIQDIGHYSTQVSDTFRVSEGTASELLLTDAAGRCVLLADVEEAGATLRPGGSCTYPGDNGLTVTLTLTRGTVSLSGGSGRFDMAGTVTATARGRLYPGSYFQNATLTRVGK
ncbi:hypothetical protein NR798_11415 [Archangium gephyra]|uniref:hypothetical protein n=1 Tax=Archangium gephyra TaxID=48 RepID=UPI0035D4DC59